MTIEINEFVRSVELKDNQVIVTIEKTMLGNRTLAFENTESGTYTSKEEKTLKINSQPKKEVGFTGEKRIKVGLYKTYVLVVKNGIVDYWCVEDPNGKILFSSNFPFINKNKEK